MLCYTGNMTSEVRTQQQKSRWRHPVGIILVAMIILVVGGLIGYVLPHRTAEPEVASLAPLPPAELSEGLRGKYGIDKNINETTIDNYLDRGDTVYRDVRMLVDPATWENKGGDRYLSGYIRGFEVVPSVYLSGFTDEYIEQKRIENVSGLYTGDTLFSLQDDGSYRANYEESMDILEAIFPKDKNIFIMCGAGGYAGQVRELLLALGWDPAKVRDIGGYWYYKGDNAIQVKEQRDGKDYYNFSKVPYYDIDFSKLHKLDQGRS